MEKGKITPNKYNWQPQSTVSHRRTITGCFKRPDFTVLTIQLVLILYKWRIIDFALAVLSWLPSFLLLGNSCLAMLPNLENHETRVFFQKIWKPGPPHLLSHSPLNNRSHPCPLHPRSREAMSKRRNVVRKPRFLLHNCEKRKLTSSLLLSLSSNYISIISSCEWIENYPSQGCRCQVSLSWELDCG